MDGTIILDKLTQLSNLEYEIFEKDTHKYNIIRYFDKIHSEKDNYILKIKELKYELEVKNEEINIIKENHKQCKERIEEYKNEVNRLNKTISEKKNKCSNCGKNGHNKASCPSIKR
tara:strand:- start:119 stop:466 length:348 start_codon:yes stop_codon:yes gene_type:complete